jgi:hypothetical protein
MHEIKILREQVQARRVEEAAAASRQEVEKAVQSGLLPKFLHQLTNEESDLTTV